MTLLDAISYFNNVYVHIYIVMTSSISSSSLGLVVDLMELNKLNWICYAKTSNTVLDLASKIIVHFYIHFTSRFLKQIWLFPYPYGFCNLVRIHGMKINDMIWYMIRYDMIWYDTIRYEMIWYDMIWYDMIWYDMIWYDIKSNIRSLVFTHDWTNKLLYRW
jgi:hypothetical protein